MSDQSTLKRVLDLKPALTPLNPAPSATIETVEDASRLAGMTLGMAGSTGHPGVAGLPGMVMAMGGTAGRPGDIGSPGMAIPAHYDKPVTPWDLQAHMDSTGSAFADARLADVIDYVFRTKGDRRMKLEDLRKAQHCLAAAIDNLEGRFNA